MKMENKNTVNYYLATVYAQAFLREHNIDIQTAINHPKYDKLVKSYFELLELGIEPDL